MPLDLPAKTKGRPEFVPIVPDFLEGICSGGFKNQELALFRLPDEILHRILAMVAVAHVPSVEECARTCRRMYLLSQSDSVWCRICASTSASVCLVQAPRVHQDYRAWFFERPRVRTDGVFICKLTYFRPGYNADAFSQPVHVVTYYRYLRFFGERDGYKVLALVSTAEPRTVLDQLRSAPRVDQVDFGADTVQRRRRGGSQAEETKARPNMLVGRYHRDPARDDVFCLALYDPHSTQDICFHMEVQMAVTKLAKPHALECQSYYAVVQASDEHVEYSVSGWNRFYFSRVRSYIT